MNLEQQLSLATSIAIGVHDGQFDKNGKPYINHVFRVMNAGQTMQEKIVGVLHDVIEDSDMTIEDLIKHGFGTDILDAVDAMTHYDNETYDAYIDRVISNPIAIRVKINDLTDNMDISRLKVMDNESIDRLKRYFSAYNKIINSFK